MEFDINKLKEIATPLPEKTRQMMEYRRENRDWLLKSARIAVELHRLLRLKGMTQKQLAVLLDVSPTQVSKILKGTENLGLKTICKIEKVIGAELVSVPNSYDYQNNTDTQTYVPVMIIQSSPYCESNTTFQSNKTASKDSYQLFKSIRAEA